MLSAALRARVGLTTVAVAWLVLAACAATSGSAEVAIVGLEAVTYTNGSLTFEVAVVGAPVDSVELRRDGALFQVLIGSTYTSDTTAAPEASYVFVARARRGDLVSDSEPKTVAVDRTPPTVALATAFAWPFDAQMPEILMPSATTGAGPTMEDLDVTALVEADANAGRARSQFRLRNQYNGPGGLGGTAFYAEVGDGRVPTLVVEALVP